MAVLEDAAKVIAKFENARNAGAVSVQSAIAAGANPIEDSSFAACIAAFSQNYPEWVADDGLEEVNRIKYYPATKMAYICIAQINRYSHYTPDVATNNYCPFPEPDADGIYPYVYGMMVWPEMKVRSNGVVYNCIMPAGTYKLVYDPANVASIFEIWEG